MAIDLSSETTEGGPARVLTKPYPTEGQVLKMINNILEDSGTSSRAETRKWMARSDTMPYGVREFLGPATSDHNLIEATFDTKDGLLRLFTVCDGRDCTTAGRNATDYVWGRPE